MTRIVGARGAGVFFAAVAVFTILSNITELGADTGIVRFIARLREQGRHGDLRPLVWVALVPAVAVATLAGIATVVWAEPIAEVLSRSNPADVATYLRIFGRSSRWRRRRPSPSRGPAGSGRCEPFVAIQSIATPALKPVLILLAAIGGLTVTGLALGWAIPEAFACVAALVILVRRVGRVQGRDEAAEHIDRRSGKEFWAFSAPRGVAAAFQITIIWFDLLLLSHLRDATEVGIYGAASRAVTIGTFALQAIRLAIAPQISRLLARGDRAQAQTVYQTATWWLIVVSGRCSCRWRSSGPRCSGSSARGSTRVRRRWRSCRWRCW